MSASSQVTTTQIIGSILNDDGTNFSGPLIIQGQTFTSSGQAVMSTVLNKSVQNGRLTVALIPNDTATPAFTSYSFTFGTVAGTGNVWICVVPTSDSPVQFTSACSMSVAPSPTTMVSVSQLTPATTNGTVLATIGGITLWTALPSLAGQSLVALNALTVVSGTLAFCSDCKNVVDDGVVAGSVATSSGHGTFVGFVNGSWRTLL